MGNDIDGILARLQKTLSSKDKDKGLKESSVKPQNFELDRGSDGAVVEKPSVVDAEVRSKILEFFYKDLEAKFDGFFANQEGRQYLEEAIDRFLNRNKSLIENMIKREIHERIRNIQL